MKIDAVFFCKEPSLSDSLRHCEVKKIVTLDTATYDLFTKNLTQDWDFISESNDLMVSENHSKCCLLVLGEDRTNGILVDSQGYDYPRYWSLIPNAKDIILANKITDSMKQIIATTSMLAEHISKDCITNTADSQSKTYSWEELMQLNSFFDPENYMHMESLVQELAIFSESHEIFLSKHGIEIIPKSLTESNTMEHQEPEMSL